LNFAVHSTATSTGGRHAGDGPKASAAAARRRMDTARTNHHRIPRGGASTNMVQAIIGLFIILILLGILIAVVGKILFGNGTT
jgi:hypothetical protein